jgi:hypothetical protein
VTIFIIIVKIIVSWDVMPCSLGDIWQHFGRTCYLHLHVRRESRAWQTMKDGLCLRHGNLSSTSCKNARSILHRFLMMRFSNQATLEPAHTGPSQDRDNASVRASFIFFLFLSPYSALNTCSVFLSFSHPQYPLFHLS